MKLEWQQYVSDLLSTEKTSESRFVGDSFERTEQRFHVSCSQLVDYHSKYGVRVCYLRITSGDSSAQLCISTSGTVAHALAGTAVGTLLKVNYEERQYTIWLPPAPAQYSNITQSSPDEALVWLPFAPATLSFDKDKRINTGSSSLALYQWEIQPSMQLIASPSNHVDEVAVVPYMVMEDSDGQLFAELSSLSKIERRLYRKATWFYPRTPADIWNYLIDGSLYDPRFSSKGTSKRFKCQQCAYAWWNYFNFLHKQTGKKIYTILQDEVAYSVLLDMTSDGKWSHGFWSDDMETHARFHLDGLHLLISQYEKTDEVIWLQAAKRGMTFVLERLTEKLDNGELWFLHDTIEHSRWKSTLFGKSPENSLCINTHIQALTVLHRLHTVAPEQGVYAEIFDSGAKALQRVLDYQPAEVLYRPLMSWVVKYKTAKKKRSKLDKMTYYLQTPLLLVLYWSTRRLFPRIMHSNGFIDRDISATFAPDGYHIVNLKDLLTLYQQKQFTWLSAYITSGVNLVRQLDLADGLQRNLQYIEWLDTLYMYSKLIEQVPSAELEAVEQTIYQQTGGYSLDYYASCLVRQY